MAYSGSEPRINNRIRAPQVRVIGPNGQHLGIMPTAQALGIARANGLDLVEVSPNADPPVCKILDFGKYMYEQAKREKEAKKHQAGTRVKEVQLSVNISPHDLATKARHAIEFLCDDMKVKVTLRFHGREMQHTELGFDVVRKFLAQLMPYGHPDMEPKLNGRMIHVVISPLPRNKRAPNPFEQNTQAAGQTRESAQAKAGSAAPGEARPATDNSAPSKPAGFVNNPFSALAQGSQAS